MIKEVRCLCISSFTYWTSQSRHFCTDLVQHQFQGSVRPFITLFSFSFSLEQWLISHGPAQAKTLFGHEKRTAVWQQGIRQFRRSLPSGDSDCAFSDTEAKVSFFITSLLGFSYSFLSQEMCAHRQSAWHPTAVSKENLHRDGILVPVDLFLMLPVTAVPMNGTSCLSFARGIKKNQELYSTVG